MNKLTQLKKKNINKVIKVDKNRQNKIESVIIIHCNKPRTQTPIPHNSSLRQDFRLSDPRHMFPSNYNKTEKKAPKCAMHTHREAGRHKPPSAVGCKHHETGVFSRGAMYRDVRKRGEKKKN